MKVRPVKPHFFKPIQPGFKHALKIPVGFLKYLKGYKKEHAILRKDGKKWLVKVNGYQLEEGWGKFAEEHDLQLGDMLVFRHEGNMEFEVTIFDSSHCDREYAEYMLDEEEANNVEFKDKPSAEADTHNPFGQSHFLCTVRPYCLKGYLCIPTRFAAENGLTNKNCGLIIRDERQRSWNLRLYTSCSRVYIGGIWGEFRVANDLKVGDRIMFEIVTNGEKPIWKFHDISIKPSDMIPLNAQVSTPTSGDNDLPYFISTIKPYSIKKSVLYFPLDFAKSNGLINRKCEMILKDEAQRSWSVWLGRDAHHFGIIRGWTKFRAANCLQVGDVYKFELITNAKIPIAYFRCKYSAEVAKREDH
ncbi:B3 domain-containing protein REM10-like isoform X2 [Nicotiana tabacum]|uniref:B3 domain-containing protein REM10-like isoform X2 n=1 Tax=Nicotiana tabacum TaxID=4097 RepID=A0AC58SP53_TOBAC|nr:PREDICTED: B3 domain-containing protein REM10-like [Nicotiana tabacum]XP_018630037.1 B3 domain-containing protein REM10-like isoform X1 [Nicotiana tomentosiformis]